jgi:endonuclease/exonuclease/phosphatase (EEP) superfamily protein YafD
VRARLRSALLVVSWVATAGLVAVLIARLVGFDGFYPMTQVVAFMPYYPLGGAALVAAFLAQRRWYAVVLPALATLVLAALVVPRAVAGGAGSPAGVVRLRVMSVNLRVGGADVGEIAALAVREDVDVIAFQEFTVAAQARLDAVGLSAYSYRSIHPRELALGSAIYSRLPMTDDGVRRHGSGFDQARGTLAISGVGPVAIESAHPCAPTGSARSRCWSDDLADQPPSANGGNGRILLGDFNATLDHAPLRRLLSAGYADAASAVGQGLTPTWPYDKPIPKITLDHVLINSRLAATGFSVYAVAGTDHRCVVADLTVRAS